MGAIKQMANPFIAMVFGYLKEQGIDTKDMSVQEAIDKYQEMNKEENNTKDGYEGLHKKTRTAKITKQEWAIYYKIIGDEQHGDFIYRTKFGQRAVRVETDNSYKIFIDNGEYDNVRVSAVYSFASTDDVSDTIDYMRTIGVIL